MAKRKEYLTLEEFEKQIDRIDQNTRTAAREINSCRVILLMFVAFAITVTFLLGLMVNYDTDLRSALAEQYTFSEDECVAVGSMNCTRYCHAEQVQVREECETTKKETTLIAFVNATFLVDFKTRIQEERRGDAEQIERMVNSLNFTNLTIKNECSVSVNDASATYYCKFNYTDHSIFTDETSCAPIYKNDYTFCATPEEIERFGGKIV